MGSFEPLEFYTNRYLAIRQMHLSRFVTQDDMVRLPDRILCTGRLRLEIHARIRAVSIPASDLLN